jgi:hypothetical protein
MYRYLGPNCPVNGIQYDAVGCCLQDHRKRPDTASLLSNKAVRDAAAELGLDLPAATAVAKPALAGIAPHVMASAGPGALAGAACITHVLGMICAYFWTQRTLGVGDQGCELCMLCALAVCRLCF